MSSGMRSRTIFSELIKNSFMYSVKVREVELCRDEQTVSVLVEVDVDVFVLDLFGQAVRSKKIKTS